MTISKTTTVIGKHITGEYSDRIFRLREDGKISFSSTVYIDSVIPDESLGQRGTWTFTVEFTPTGDSK